MAIADTVIRTGNIVSLGESHQVFFESMLDEDVPDFVTIGQARRLVARMHKLKFEYPNMMMLLLENIEALLNCQPN